MLLVVFCTTTIMQNTKTAENSCLCLNGWNVSVCGEHCLDNDICTRRQSIKMATVQEVSDMRDLLWEASFSNMAAFCFSLYLDKLEPISFRDYILLS